MQDRPGSGRVVSLDSSSYGQRCYSSDSATRSYSAASVMQPLSFNRVHEDIAHPLSSLRSCSEFGLNGLSTAAQHKEHNRKSKSLWARLFHWGSDYDSEDRESLEMSLRPHEDETVPSCMSLHTERSSSRSISGCSRTSSFVSPMKTKPRKRRRPEPSVSAEVAATLDFVFGFGSKSKDPPKEIELKDLKNPSALAQLSAHMEPTTTIFPDLPIRRTVSLRSFQQIIGEDGRSSSSHSSETGSVHSAAHTFNPFSLADWTEAVIMFVDPYTSAMRVRGQVEDNELFYTLQGQPFSSGIYLRGMLSAGMNNTLFHTYSLLFLPQLHLPGDVSLSALWFQRAVVGLLVLQVLLNLVATPIRVLLHYTCWSTCRSLDAETASQALQDLVQSDTWMLNRILAWTLDIVALVVLGIGQIYLWATAEGWVGNASQSATDPLLAVLVGMCATNMLSFLMRAAVAVVYFISFIDTREEQGRRRGGLSNFDLDRMPTFVYTNKEEVVNDECSICLTQFQMGEMLISLPCHQRHSFHAGCIREWLHRQNVCPLCQKTC